MRPFYLSIVFFFLLLLLTCNDGKKEEKYVIGFSQCMMDDVWRQAMMLEMNIEASNYDNIEIIVKDADENSHKQIQQIRELIQQKVDVLIISPNESVGLTPIAEEAYQLGIPTIIVDRKINSDEYTAYVGGDSYQIGKMAGEYASALLPKNSTILEIWGTKSTSPAQERHKGFIDGLEASKEFTFLSVEGKWRREIAKEETDKIKNFENIDLIYAHNDVMAIGAREIILEQDSALLSHIKILGVDGAFGNDAGLEAVADGRLTASFLYPTGGDQVIKIAAKILQGHPVDKAYILNTAMIDKSTAQTLMLQSNQLINYQNRIEQQRENINTILNRFSILRHSLVVILLLMGLLLLFAIYIYYINRKINRRNQQLRVKNKEIELQKGQLIELNEKIKEVNDQKIRFFMNVSHEVRTPLTLIISPLEKWIKKTTESPLLTDLTRIKKNADRLTLVINQLLDFRKIEMNKINLNLQQQDIVVFSAAVKSLFDELAETKKINYTFTSNQPHILLWFDTDKMEKVLVNLLSNAFKFTKENGIIRINVKDDGEHVFISVFDNGCGIAVEKQAIVFDRFYSGNDSNNAGGTGIGLHLTQEFVKMHNGLITVESVPNKYTVFRVQLRKGDSHFIDSHETVVPKELFETTGADVEITFPEEIIRKKYPYTILIVEDDPEIRAYLADELSENFAIITANNGADAFKTVLENEDITLVLSDVLMPELSGFELCRKIKTSPELSDVPVILITALAEENQRIHGIAEGADDYIQKPFNIDYVRIKIIKLLEERKRMQKRFMQAIEVGGIPIINTETEMESSDKLFIQKFATLLESSFQDPTISIEKLSDDMGVSRVHLYRKVKEITGFSPVDYLRNFRLSKATNLLAKRQFSISEIAYQIGFSSPAYFSKCFKDVFNMTPSDFLKK